MFVNIKKIKSCFTIRLCITIKQTLKRYFYYFNTSISGALFYADTLSRCEDKQKKLYLSKKPKKNRRKDEIFLL